MGDNISQGTEDTDGLVHQEIGGGQMEKTAEKHDDDAPERVKIPGKRPWNEKEKTAVKRRMTKFIALKKVPGKDECLMCIAKESPVLSARSWKDVKYFVYNEIAKVKKKLAL